MWRKAFGLSIVFGSLVLFSSSVVFASSNTYTLTEEQMQTLQSNSNRQEEINKQLQTELTTLKTEYLLLKELQGTSNEISEKLLKKLGDSLIKIDKLQNDLAECQTELTAARNSSVKAQNELAQANQSFKEYSASMKRQLVIAKTERDLLLLYEIFKLLHR